MTVPETAVLVRGDEAQLEQSVHNLLENSLKFTPPPGEIRLSLAVEAETAVIMIRDTGVGIPQEDVAHLFSRLHRGKNTANYPGNGLGLSLVKTIITHHDGVVSIQNEDRGTKAQIWLPILTITE